MAIAQADPPLVQAGDAADWTEAQIDPAPEPGVTRVLMHSVAWIYLSKATRTRISAHMAAAGACATPNAPLAWLQFEPPPGYLQPPSLRLQTWPGGAVRLLGNGSPHGQSLRWTGSWA